MITTSTSGKAGSLLDDDLPLPEVLTLSPTNSECLPSSTFQVFDSSDEYVGFASGAGFKSFPKTEDAVKELTQCFNSWLTSKLQK